MYKTLSQTITNIHNWVSKKTEMYPESVIRRRQGRRCFIAETSQPDCYHLASMVKRSAWENIITRYYSHFKTFHTCMEPWSQGYIFSQADLGETDKILF